MATRSKRQAKRTGGGNTPGWIWLIVGLIVGAVLLMVFVPGAMKKDGADDFFHASPKPNADAKPAPVDGDDDAPVATAANNKSASAAPATAAKPTQYEFYDALLQGKEVAISDADLAKRARAEAAAAKLRQDAIDADTKRSAANAPKPLDENSAQAAATHAASPAPTQATAASATPASGNGAHYLLQAGAFGASGDAEALKAKIAFLGLNARVESADINGKTVYRVRMGPYGSASELTDAKQKLTNGGLPAVAIKAQ